MSLVLSLFPGIGLLDRAFEAEAFTIVRGPDVIWGGDIRTFHPPAGRFDGIIGGDPCQSHSLLANLVRAKGLEPSFPDMTPEFQRVIEAAQPRWFLRENVPGAPDIKPAGYDVHTFMLHNERLDRGDGFGEEQIRKRRWWFGMRWFDLRPAGRVPDLRRWIRECAMELPAAPAVAGDARAVPVRLGGSGKVKRTAVGGAHGDFTLQDQLGYRERASQKVASVTGRHNGDIGVTGGHPGKPGRYTLAEMLELQGLPADFLDHCPFTVEAKRKAIGNGVPQAMGRALARAVRSALDYNWTTTKNEARNSPELLSDSLEAPGIEPASGVDSKGEMT